MGPAILKGLRRVRDIRRRFRPIKYFLRLPIPSVAILNGPLCLNFDKAWIR